jgi:CRISPR-associated protein Csm4
MKTRIYKFSFKTEVHFGNGTLDHSVYTIFADTLFSAMCIEAQKMGCINTLYQAVKQDHLLFSDGFPFIKDRFYLPKPCIKVSRDSGETLSKEHISQRKKFKKLTYIAADLFDDYLKGKDIFDRNNFENLGKTSLRTKAAIRNGTDETLPYHVGTFKFNEGCGLYFIVNYDDDSVITLCDELIKAISYVGIGGKRTAGLGRFDLTVLSERKEIESVTKLLKTTADSQNGKMLLSVALPLDNELDNALTDAQYLLVKRSGFTAPDNNETELLKKKDLYVFSSGSYFKNTFKGDVYDVSRGASHPVYRYAKPMFMEIKAS